MADQPSYARPYLDAAVYIAVIKNEQGRAGIAREILFAAERHQQLIVASPLLIAEVSWPSPHWSQERIDRYFEHGFFRWVELDSTLGVQARELARQHGLKGADAVHLASALRGGADTLLTWDERLLGVREQVTVPICEPYWIGQPTLPGTASRG